jgi:uncharacterized protein YggU (UPF0235/DUF167 family)
MYVKVKVDPGAKRERVVRENDNTFTMAVKEPAERNLANKRVRELLANAFGVTLQQVRLVTGHHSGSKIYEVELAAL